ncbi:dynamin family protein [Glutamicibacter endophyticus]
MVIMEVTGGKSKDTSQHPAEPTSLLQAVDELETALGRVRIVGEDPSAVELKRTIKQVTDQVGDYVRPRIDSLDAPLVVVLGGSTGAGKSTIANSLLRQRVSISSAVRPTTRVPVLVCHPQDRVWFENQRVFPGLARRYGSVSQDSVAPGGNQSIQIVTDRSMTPGLALVDAPDIDSVSAANRQLAGQLMAAADMWLFVTTASRYADAVPWTALDEAAQRNITISVVLNRVPSGTEAEVREDLQRLLTERNLRPIRLHLVLEQPLDDEGFLPDGEVTELRTQLEDLANDAQERQRIAQQTLAGVLTRLAATVHEIQNDLADQEQELRTLHDTAQRYFDRARERSLQVAGDGSLLRGEILTRWQDFVGTGEFFRGVEGFIGRLRDKVGSYFSGREQSPQKVEQAIESGIHTIISREIGEAARDTERQWGQTALGRVLNAEAQDRWRSEDLDEATTQLVRNWQRDILDMIRAEGAGKRKTARLAAFGVNGVAVVLMVVVFASTAGLTGLEVGIAGGSAVVGQKLLEAIFGEEAVRRMAATARASLESRIAEVVDQFATPYLQSCEALEQGELVRAVNTANQSLIESLSRDN